MPFFLPFSVGRYTQPTPREVPSAQPAMCEMKDSFCSGREQHVNRSQRRRTGDRGNCQGVMESEGKQAFLPSPKDLDR